MTENTKIEWADHTFNPWVGCTKVSPGCDNCYAAAMAKRVGWDVWGAGKPRRLTSEAYWRKPLRWDRAAAAEGVRRRVFPSMCDPFDAEVPAEWLSRLWGLIHATPNLDWLLLTKRPNQIKRSLPPNWGEGWENVWLGTSVESQDQDWRIMELLRVPAAVRFLSCEPLLGRIDLHFGELAVVVDRLTDDEAIVMREKILDLYRGLQNSSKVVELDHPARWDHLLHWVIVGGESGPGARLAGGSLEAHELAIRSLVTQCQTAGVAAFVKQQGSVWARYANLRARVDGGPHSDLKGGNPEAWPEDLRVREIPGGGSAALGAPAMRAGSAAAPLGGMR